MELDQRELSFEPDDDSFNPFYRSARKGFRTRGKRHEEVEHAVPRGHPQAHRGGTHVLHQGSQSEQDEAAQRLHQKEFWRRRVVVLLSSVVDSSLNLYPCC